MVPFFAYGILYHVLCLGIFVPMLRGGADWAGTTFSACSFSCGGPISSLRSGS